MFNPYFREEDIIAFLRQRCATVKGGTKLPHPFGCWLGKNRYACKLKADPKKPGEFIHLPGNITIGAKRGLLSYPGQPQFCWKCGAEGHEKEDCVGPRCRFCGSEGHLAAACTAPRTCSLCGDEGHLFARCPQRRVSYADVVSGEAAVGAGGEDGRQPPSVTQRQQTPYGHATAPEAPLLAVEGTAVEEATPEAVGAPSAGAEGECALGEQEAFPRRPRSDGGARPPKGVAAGGDQQGSGDGGGRVGAGGRDDGAVCGSCLAAPRTDTVTSEPVALVRQSLRRRWSLRGRMTMLPFWRSPPLAGRRA